MIVINEFLPNPEGADAAGEWVEFRNIGDVPASLAGWRLKTENGKSVALPAKTIGAGEYLVVSRQAAKFTLKNQNGALTLLDPGGRSVDTLAFVGDAPEGKSVNPVRSPARDESASPQDPGGATSNGVNRSEGGYVFAAPTPGAVNVETKLALIGAEPIPGPLFLPGGAFPAILSGLAIALLLAGLMTFLVQKNHALQELFFGGDEKTG
ncbi:MAG: lamin tail domain-containing protein [Patescibacteria group bacterium]